MRFDILTIFPNIFDSYLKESIILRAIKKSLINIHIHDIREFSKDKHHKVDNVPFGGGAGMVMTPQPLYDAIKYVKKYNKGKVIYLTPQGELFTQIKAERYAKEYGKSKSKEASAKTPNARRQENFDRSVLAGTRGSKFSDNEASGAFAEASKGLILICGRYEGIDQRIRDLLVDEEISIGKFVLTGGELPAMIMVDSISRLISGVLGKEQSHLEDSFSLKLKRKKEYPHYTRPPVFKEKKVPEVLMSGNHKKIEEWRKSHLK